MLLDAMRRGGVQPLAARERSLRADDAVPGNEDHKKSTHGYLHPHVSQWPTPLPERRPTKHRAPGPLWSLCFVWTRNTATWRRNSWIERYGQDVFWRVSIRDTTPGASTSGGRLAQGANTNSRAPRPSAMPFQYPTDSGLNRVLATSIEAARGEAGSTKTTLTNGCKFRVFGLP